MSTTPSEEQQVSSTAINLSAQDNLGSTTEYAQAIRELSTSH